MMQNPIFRLPTAALLALTSVFLTGACIANPAADTDLSARLTALEQEIATERAERISFDQQNAILIAENAELKQKLISFTTKKTLQEALGTVVDHAAEMRQQLSESQERVEGIAHQLQVAMSQHAELQDELEAKQRSLYAHATTLQRHLEDLPTDFEYPETQEPQQAPVVAEVTTPEEADWLALPPIATAEAPIVEAVEEEAAAEVESAVEIEIVEAVEEEVVAEVESAVEIEIVEAVEEEVVAEVES